MCTALEQSGTLCLLLLSIILILSYQLPTFSAHRPRSCLHGYAATLQNPYRSFFLDLILMYSTIAASLLFHLHHKYRRQLHASGTGTSHSSVDAVDRFHHIALPGQLNW